MTRKSEPFVPSKRSSCPIFLTLLSNLRPDGRTEPALGEFTTLGRQRIDGFRLLPQSSQLHRRLSLERPRLENALWSTFNDPALLKHRVQQLTRGIPVAAPSHPRRAASTAVLAVGAVAMLVPLLSDTIHTITEAVIAFLP